MFKLTSISIAILIAALFNIFTTYLSWQRRRTKGGYYFALAMLALTIWTIFAGLDYAAVPISLKVIFAKLESLGYGPALSLMAAFTITYAGRETLLKKNWVRFLLIFLPLSSILLILTDSLHGWVWSGWAMSEAADNVLIFQHGPAFTWITFTGYFFIVVMLVNLLDVSFTGLELSRKQARLLLFGLLVPVIGNLIYLTGVSRTPGVDWSSIFFSLTGLLFLFALYGRRFMDIVPSARNAMIEKMEDGILVLDDHSRLVDFNPAAQAMLGIQNDDLWNPIQTVLSRWPDDVAVLADPSTETMREIRIGEKTFDVRVTFLNDERDRPYGQLLVMRDITVRKKSEEALLKSEAQNRAIVNSVPDLLFRIDRQGIILDYYSRDNSLLYAPPEAFLNKLLASVLPAHISKLAMEALEKSLATNQVILFEYTMERNGETKYYENRITPLGIDEVLAVIRDITERVQQEEALRQTQNQLLEQQRVMVVIDERQRLARDLHDSVSQSLHSVNLFAETLSSVLARGNMERGLQLAERLQESARQALKEARLLLYQLRPTEDADIDLFRDLEARLSAVERRAGMRAAVILDGSLDDFPAAWMEHLFRITIEALNNALKYAQAHEVKVTITCAPPVLELEIADDGIGFEPQFISSGGMGIRSMRERAELIGGTLKLFSAPEKGCRVLVHAEMKEEK
jgi:PAS domain S-box-containing protein